MWTGVNRCEKFWPGLNKSEQVWSTVFPRRRVARSPSFAYPSTKLLHLYTFQKPFNICWKIRVLLVILIALCACVCECVCVRVCTNAFSSYTVGRTVSKFCLPQKPATRYLTVLRSKLYDPPSDGNRALSHFRWRKVWNGVKCNFSSPHHNVRKIVKKLSIRPVRIWNFNRIGPKTKKLRLSIVLARRLSEHTSLGPHQKGVNCNFSWPEFDKPYGVRKVSISDA